MRCAPGFRRRDRARDAGLPGDRPHRLPGQSVRRRGAAEREPAEGPSAQSDARFESRPRAGAAEPPRSAGRPRRRRARRGWPCGARLADLSAAQGLGAAIADAVFDRDLETHRRVAVESAALDRRLRHGARARRARWWRTGRVKSGAKAAAEAPRRRPGGVPRRQLLGRDARADRQRRAAHAGAAPRRRTRSSPAEAAGGARLGDGDGSAAARC